MPALPELAAHEVRNQRILIIASRTEELQRANARLREEMQERVLAEKELRHSEERFAKAFQASPIPLAIQSLTNGRFIDINDAFLAMTSFRRIEIISRTPYELALCPSAERQTELMVTLRHERSLRGFECQLRTRTEELRECVVSAEA